MLNDELKQQISLLVDDRLDAASAARVFRALESDEDAAAVYSRYLSIGKFVRSGSASLTDVNFADRVQSAIENEPTLLAPVWKRSLRDRAVTAALAAALAGIAVMVGESVFVQPNFYLPGISQQATLSEPAEMPGSMQDYLVNHNGAAYLGANGGLLPYLRVVSYGKPQR